MKSGLFLVVLFGVVLGGCAAPGDMLYGKPSYQVVGGLIVENKHSPKWGLCSPKQAEKGVCWRELSDVEDGKGKPTRNEKYYARDSLGQMTVRYVEYYDTDKQTEVYVIDSSFLLRDDFVTSIPNFSLKQDRHDYGY